MTPTPKSSNIATSSESQIGSYEIVPPDGCGDGVYGHVVHDVNIHERRVTVFVPVEFYGRIVALAVSQDLAPEFP